jgi:hypothetical protein
MHYKEFLLHLAHASILAFPVCYMNDTSLGVSHADGKGKSIMRTFPVKYNYFNSRYAYDI